MRTTLALCVAATLVGCNGGGAKKKPEALAASFQTLEDAPVSGTVTGTAGAGGVLSFEVRTAPVAGSVTLDPATGAFTYDPDVHAIGQDPFTFVAIEGGRESEPATVTIDIGLLSASYGSLRAVLTDVLGISDAGTLAAGCAAPETCPISHPLAYLDEHRDLLDSGIATGVPGRISKEGYEVWVLAAAAACGRMMQTQPTPALFPAGVANYDGLFDRLLGRPPVAADVATMQDLQGQFALNEKKGAAACAAVLASLEFVAVH